MNKQGKLEASQVVFSKSELTSLGSFILKIFSMFKLVQMKEEGKVVHVNNLTVINLILIWVGPLHEATLTIVLLCFQVCSYSYMIWIHFLTYNWQIIKWLRRLRKCLIISLLILIRKINLFTLNKYKIKYFTKNSLQQLWICFTVVATFEYYCTSFSEILINMN